MAYLLAGLKVPRPKLAGLRRRGSHQRRDVTDDGNQIGRASKDLKELLKAELTSTNQHSTG
jgi:hypothetical protein